MSTLQTIGIIVGVVSGVSGVVLGIVNYWERRVSTRPRIVVRPCFRCLIEEKDGKPDAAYVALMEIRNVGQVPVVGSAFGFLSAQSLARFLPRGMRKGKLARLLRGQNLAYGATFLEHKPLHKGLEWRREVPPQHSAVLRFEPGVVPLGKKIGRAYAETIVGDVFKASRRDMRIFLKEYKHLSQEDDAATTDDHSRGEDAS